MKKITFLLIFLILLGIFVSMFFVIAANTYYPDIIVDPTDVVINDTTVTDTFVEINGNITTVQSLRVYKNCTYRIDQHIAYLTVYSGVDSHQNSSFDINSFDIKIYDDFSAIEKLYIEGAGNQLLIWQKSILGDFT